MKVNYVTLNITDEILDKYGENILETIYKSTEGWMGYTEEFGATWFSSDIDKKHIFTSLEYGGLMVSGRMIEEEWNEWLENFLAIASKKFGFKIYDIEE